MLEYDTTYEAFIKLLIALLSCCRRRLDAARTVADNRRKSLP